MLIEQFAGIKEFAFLPERAIDSYRKMSGNTRSTSYEVQMKINEEYKKAAAEEGCKIIFKSGNMVVDDMNLADRVCIITDIPAKKDGSAIVLLLMPNRNKDRQPWELQGVVSENELCTF